MVDIGCVFFNILTVRNDNQPNAKIEYTEEKAYPFYKYAFGCSFIITWFVCFASQILPYFLFAIIITLFWSGLIFFLVSICHMFSFLALPKMKLNSFCYLMWVMSVCNVCCMYDVCVHNLCDDEAWTACLYAM